MMLFSYQSLSTIMAPCTYFLRRKSFASSTSEYKVRGLILIRAEYMGLKENNSSNFFLSRNAHHLYTKCPPLQNHHKLHVLTSREDYRTISWGKLFPLRQAGPVQRSDLTRHPWNYPKEPETGPLGYMATATGCKDIFNIMLTICCQSQKYFGSKYRLSTKTDIKLDFLTPTPPATTHASLKVVAAAF